MKIWMCGILVLTLLLAGLSGLAEGEWAWIEEPTPALSGRLSGIVIGIDPGHQSRQNSEHEAVAPGSSETKPKVSSGTAGVKSGIAEYIVVLDVGLQLRDALEAMGATVYMTRETHDVDISNQERAVMMNELGADLVLRIHCNGSTNRSTNGIGLYVNKTGPIAEDSIAAAEAILPAMTAATGARADGIFRRDTYTGLNWSEVPCILVEMGFIQPRNDRYISLHPMIQEIAVEELKPSVDNCGKLLDGLQEISLLHGIEMSGYKQLFQTVENIIALIRKDDLPKYLLFLENVFEYMASGEAQARYRRELPCGLHCCRLGSARRNRNRGRSGL